MPHPAPQTYKGVKADYLADIYKQSGIGAFNPSVPGVILTTQDNYMAMRSMLQKPCFKHTEKRYAARPGTGPVNRPWYAEIDLDPKVFCPRLAVQEMLPPAGTPP